MITRIICTIPGVGKSTFKRENSHLKIVDDFETEGSWFEKLDKINLDFRTFDVRKRFVTDLLNDNVGMVDFMFFNIKEVVISTLKELNFNFEVILPNKEMKDEFIERFKRRNEPPSIIEWLSDDWENQLDEAYLLCKEEKITILKREEYLNDAIKFRLV